MSGQRTTDDAAYRRDLSQLWPLTPGKEVSVRFAPASQPANVAQRTFRVVGPRRMPIAGADRDVIVIEQNHESANFSFTWTLFYDPATRVFLGGDVRSVRGSSPGTSWRVERVELPSR
jgi:hypothetical protein